MFRFRRIGQILHDNFFAEQSRWFASVPFLFALGIAIYFGLPFEPNMWVVLGVFSATRIVRARCQKDHLAGFAFASDIFVQGVKAIYQLLEKSCQPFRLHAAEKFRESAAYANAVF